MGHEDPRQWPQIFYGTAWKQTATAELTDQAIGAGFRALDTANQPQHYRESDVGQGIALALARRGVCREQLFIQTKFSPLHAQGTDVPYTRHTGVARQAEESLAGSLAHLGTDYLDALLLHAPRHPRRMVGADWETWAVFEDAYRRGVVRRIGVSNMGVAHLRELLERANVPPMTVQNRCFARTLWDREVRSLCAHHGVAYQGFSLLTANPFVPENSEVNRIARLHEITPAQLVFAFAHGLGMIPLTGTTDPRHMVDDLAALRIKLDADELRRIEHIAAD